MIFIRPRLPLLALGFLLGARAATGQDARLAQPYAAGLLLNPALAGITAMRTASFVARNQNPEAGNNFLTGALCADARVPKVRGSVGIAFTYDRAGDAPLSRTQLQGIYAYQTPLSKRWAASAAISGGFSAQTGSLSRYVFGDQLQPDGTTAPTSETLDYVPVFYPTVGVGAVVYEKNAWVGVAMHHANAPRLGSWATAARLAPRLVVHAGYKIYLLSARALNRFYEFSLTPLFTLQQQGAARGFDAGFSATYSPVVLGILYRNPLLLNAARDQRWLVGQLGLRRPGYSIGYSYELGLSRATTGFAAHELSLRLDKADFSGLSRRRANRKQAPFAGTPPF